MNKRQRKKQMLRVLPETWEILSDLQDEIGSWPCLENMDRKRTNWYWKAALKSGEFTTNTPPHTRVYCQYEICVDGEYYTTTDIIHIPSRLPGSKESKSNYRRRWKRTMHSLALYYRTGADFAYQLV